MLISLIEIIFGKKINGVRVIPVTTKITITFTIIILVSNLSSNYINLILNRSELVSLMQDLLVKDLKEMYTYSNTQYEIFEFNGDKEGSYETIAARGKKELKNQKSVLLGVNPSGKILVQASNMEPIENFQDTKTLATMIKNLESGVDSGILSIKFNNDEYFTAYKYSKKWDLFLIRGEEKNEFFARQNAIFTNISIIILFITIVSAILGIYLLHRILRLISILTSSIMEMVSSKNLEIIDLSGAPNDDVSYLGFAFNSLSNTVNNLVNIFKKFANQDVVIKAYREKEVKLEGVQQELTIMFSDIKSFTFITETLGNDIIKLLNLHYDNAIRNIHDHDGVIGAIIGDALLAVFGALDKLESSGQNKSLQAIQSSYKIQELAKSLRDSMTAKREELLKKKKKLTKEDEKVYKAVLLEVGVGIDGGDVFYGTIGSYVRMTNTVIGDNVNAASRLEGLTRIYHLPVICSEYVKNDVDQNVDGMPVHFMEIDTVQVKGKTVGKKIYWPILEEHFTTKMKNEVEIFGEALQLYYDGKWKKAAEIFKKCQLKVASEFLQRTQGSKCPKDWNGIWEMKTK